MIVYNAKNRITNGYSKNHRAVDIGWNRNYTEEQNYLVYPNCKGIVKEIQTGLKNMQGSTGKKSWGNYVLIEHENGMFSRYAHLKDVYCRVGETVDENTSIGYMGNSGNAYGVHLHFEVQTAYSSSTRIDPTPYLTKAVYEEPTPAPQPKPSADEEFKVGDKVIVSGYATSDSNGGGSRTAEYNGTTDTLYITKITDLSKPRPYHLSREPIFGQLNRGWVAKSQIRKC